MARKTSRKTSSQAPSLDASTRICVLHGSEDLIKRTHLQTLRAALEQAHGQTETFTFDGQSAPLADVLDELRSYSLMQTYKLVIVDDADQFVKTHRPALERYAESPVDHATLVLRASTWNRGNLDKLINKVGAIVDCKPLPPEQAQSWIVKRAADEHGRKLAPAAAAALVDRLGTDLMHLDSELAKLALMVEDGQPIEPALVDEVVGRSSEEQAWAAQEAALETLATGSAKPLLDRVHELIDLAGQPEVLVAYFIADLVRKLNVAHALKAAGTPEPQIAKQLKIFGPRQRPFFAALRRVPHARAAALFHRVLHADARAKSGLGETLRNLECFSATLADEVR